MQGDDDDPQETDAGVVRLRATNIDLRVQLEKASKQIAELQEQLNQNVVRHFGLSGKQSDYVRIEEFEKLEKDLDESLAREDALRSSLLNVRGSLKEMGERADEYFEKFQAVTAELEKLKKQQTGNKKKEGESSEEDQKRIQVLEKRITEQSKKEKKLMETIEELSLQQLTMKTEQRDCAIQVQTISSHVDPNSSFSPGSKSSPMREEDRAAIDKRVDEKLAVLREQLEQQLEEDVFQVSLEMQDTIDAQAKEIKELKATNKNLQAQIAAKKKLELPPTSPTGSEIKTAAGKSSTTAAGSTPGSASGAASSPEVERAMAERNIANRVKDNALQECSLAKSELAHRDGEIEHLRHIISRLQEQGAKLSKSELTLIHSIEDRQHDSSRTAGSPFSSTARSRTQTQQQRGGGSAASSRPFDNRDDSDDAAIDLFGGTIGSASGSSSVKRGQQGSDEQGGSSFVVGKVLSDEDRSAVRALQRKSGDLESQVDDLTAKISEKERLVTSLKERVARLESEHRIAANEDEADRMLLREEIKRLKEEARLSEEAGAIFLHDAISPGKEGSIM